MERASLLHLDFYLNHPIKQIRRVLHNSTLNDIFDSKKTTIVDDDAEIVYEATKGKKKGTKAMSAEEKHWLIDGLKSKLNGQSMLKAQQALVNAMANVVKKQPLLDELGKVIGGRFVQRTAWPWKMTDSKSQSRYFTTIAQIALQEHVVVQVQRLPMMQSDPNIVWMRRTIREILEPCMRMKNTITRPDRFAPTPLRWTWPDNLDDKDFRAIPLNSKSPDGENVSRQQEVLMDRDRIIKLVQLIERSPLAAHSQGSKSIATEVRHSLDDLIDVSQSQSVNLRSNLHFLPIATELQRDEAVRPKASRLRLHRSSR